MKLLVNIVEPKKLLLTWQPADEQSPDRIRRVVAELVNDVEGKSVFRYLRNTVDFEDAVKAKFTGFPAFELNDNLYTNTPIEVFRRRLPPRSREDFSQFLLQYRLPFPFNYSDMALLAYTGARLPSDGFSLVPVFDIEQVPCDYLMEVSGVRHVIKGNLDEMIAIDDIVTFERDAENLIDIGAIQVLCRNNKIGYVNRAMLGIFNFWIDNRTVSATIERINGKPSRPLVYIRISVS
jgi:hypothetical protein